jgi:EmrB/QacA subfamily drug resistance transporter
MFEVYGRNYRWFATGTVMLTMFCTLLTSTIINVAIPEIMGSFGISQDTAQWLSTGFLAAGSITMLLSSWAIKAWGMRIIFIWSMTVFLVTTIISGTAPSVETLIIARTLQGGASGIIMPMAMLINYQVFPSDQRGAAMGIFGVGAMFAPALGPTLGGFVIDAYNWRYVFFIGIPFSLLTIPMAMMFMPNKDHEGPMPKFDWIGSIFMTIFLLVILTGLSDATEYGWTSDYIVLCLFTSFFTGVLFIWWELSISDPMLDLTLFRNPRFVAAAIVTFVIGGGLYASTYILPLFLQVLQGVPALDSGLMLLPAGVAMAFMFPIAGALSDRTQPRNLIILGLLFFGISNIALRDITINTPFIQLIYWYILGRVGLALIFPCLNAASLDSLPLHQLSQGSGAVNFVRQLGSAFGVNAVAIFTVHQTSLYSDELAVTQSYTSNTLDMFDRLREMLMSYGLPAIYEQATSASFLSRIIYNQASALAYRDAFFVIGFVFLLAIVPSLFMKVERKVIIA